MWKTIAEQWTCYERRRIRHHADAAYISITSLVDDTDQSADVPPRCADVWGAERADSALPSAHKDHCDPFQSRGRKQAVAGVPGMRLSLSGALVPRRLRICGMQALHKAALRLKEPQSQKFQGVCPSVRAKKPYTNGGHLNR